MNLNEYCLLNFLINPDGIKDLVDFFISTSREIKNKDDKNNIELL